MHLYTICNKFYYLYVTRYKRINPNYVTNLVTKFANSKLYQSQKLPNKATLSRK